MENKYTTCVMITGAAARISQEVAILDYLMTPDPTSGKQRLVINKDTTQLIGFSSGSLNLLALNLCFRYFDGSNTPAGQESLKIWNEIYKERVLWGLKDADVFDKRKLLEGSILDTTPLRATINNFIHSIMTNEQEGSVLFGDLAFHSSILTYSKDEKTTVWAVNDTGGQQSLFLTDLLMGSTAIPVVFPHQKINQSGDETSRNGFPEGKFEDGGTKGQFVNFESHLVGKKYQDLFVISPMREAGTELEEKITEELKKLKLFEAAKNEIGKLLATLNYNAFHTFLEKLSVANADNSIAENVYVCIPRLAENYGFLDFNDEQAQYNSVATWITENPDKMAVPLATYLSQNPS
ncbi:MAG: hypothetical protein NXI10_03785 [bacterium]|nr:hypothetical protein [bacterium]